MTSVREWSAELWQFRELLWFLAWRDVKVRYKQTMFGAGWALLQPLLGMVALTAFFGKVPQMADVDVPYPLFTYCALVPWTYFAATVIQGGNSFITNTPLITKVYFPRMLLPASSALSGLLDFTVASTFLVVLMAHYRIHPSWALIFYPVLVFAMWLFAVSVSAWLAALNVRYRDIKHTIPFLMQFGLLVTPVIYPTTLVPSRLQPLLRLNPLAGLMEGFRSCLFPHHRTDFGLVASSATVGVATLVVSTIYFRRTERTFADIV